MAARRKEHGVFHHLFCSVLIFRHVFLHESKKKEGETERDGRYAPIPSPSHASRADLCDYQMQIWRISEQSMLMDHYYVSLTPPSV